MTNEWEERSLGQLCTLISGRHIEAKDYNIESRGLGYLTGPADFGSLNPVVSKWTEHPQALAQKGDILITVNGAGVGKLNLLHIGKVGISRQLMAIRVSGVDPSFVYAFLETQFDHFQSLGNGATVPGLSREDILNLPISLPPLPEQRRIVSILDKAFDGIATAKVNAEKNLQNASALFESHLNAVFTKRGEGWVEKRLDEIAKVFGRGKSRHRPRNEPKLYGGKYPFIQTGDVRNAGRVIESYTQTYSELGLAQSKLWPAGTVCITIAANIGETAILGFDACIPDSVIGVVVDDCKANSKFLLYLLKSYKAHLQAQGKGSAQDNINMGTFENQSFPFPQLSIQHKIVVTLDFLAEETKRLESIYQQKLIALDALKKSLLHGAFSGQL